MFHAFVLIVLPTLYALGVFTFARLVYSSMEDLLYGRAINRIRKYYLRIAGDESSYITHRRARRPDWRAGQHGYHQSVALAAVLHDRDHGRGAQLGPGRCGVRISRPVCSGCRSGHVGQAVC
jgi:hypothetical protein